MRGILLFIFLLSPCLAKAKGGDFIRSQAPITALLYDVQAGNLGPLEEAVFNQEIDFFLEYKGVTNTVARELFYIKRAGEALSEQQFGQARQYIQRISNYPDEQTYLQGVLAAQEKRYEDSMRLFQSLIERRRSIRRDLLSRAYLGAARVAHEVSDYKQAVFYYTQIRQLEPLFFEAVFEKAWSLYLDGDMNGALGATLSFVSPYSDHVLFSEAWIVRAASFYHLCLFERASETLEDMKRRYVPLLAQVTELQKQKVESWLFSDQVLSSVDKRIIGYMVARPRYRKLQRAFLGLQKEVNRLSGDERNRAQQAFQFVRTRFLAEADRQLDRLERELKQHLAQADSIQIEILQLGINLITGAPVELRDDLRILELGDVDFDPVIQFWPFKGEFWIDELGSYYYGLKSQCDNRFDGASSQKKPLKSLAKSK